MSQHLDALASLFARMARLDIEEALEALADALLEVWPEIQSVVIFTPYHSYSFKARYAKTPYLQYVNQLMLDVKEGVWGVLSAGGACLIGDCEGQDFRSAIAFERSAVYCRLDVGEEYLGLLYLGASKPHSFAEEHRALAQVLGHYLAQRLLIEQRNLQLSSDDRLTGLAGHSLFHLRLEQECRWSEQHGGVPFCVALINLDNFKTYNDTLGLPGGDELLQGVAQLLRDKSRATDLVCRYQGDEFAIIFRESPKAQALRTCERIREAAQLRFGESQVQATVSIGLACFPSDATSKKNLMKAVVDALDVSKRAGRNRVSVAPSLDDLGLDHREDDDGGAGVPARLPTSPKGPLSAGEAKTIPVRDDEVV